MKNGLHLKKFLKVLVQKKIWKGVEPFPPQVGKFGEYTYSWMKTLNKETYKYINNENRYTDKCLPHHKLESIKKSFESLLDKVNHTEKVIEKHKGYSYMFERVVGKVLPILFRFNDVEKQMVLDQNEICGKSGFISVGELRVSPNEKLIAVTIDNKGHAHFELYIIEPINKSQLKVKRKVQSVSSYEWISDNCLMYTKIDNHTMRSFVLKCLQISTGIEEVVYTEKDPKYSLNITKSKDEEKLFLNITSKVDSEVWLIGSNGRLERLLWPRQKKSEASIDHLDGVFYNLTTDPKGELCVKKMRDDYSDEWEDFVDRRNNENFITDMALFKKFFVLQNIRDLKPGITVHGYNTSENVKDFQIARTSGHIEIENTESSSSKIVLTFTSPIQPLAFYELDPKKNTVHMKSSTLPVWNSEDFVYEQFWARSQDDTQVPVSVFYKKDTDVKEAPILCRVYGAYGQPVNMRFNQLNAYLLSRGWIIMYPHVRGGQEMGRQWYEQARLHQKHNTFNDLKYCLLAAHKNGLSSPEKTTVYGRSAGGLPVAWLLNDSPSIIRAAVMESPFISVLDPMMCSDNQLTTQEYLEWGNPRENNEDLEYIMGYCPYHNMKLSENDPSIFLCFSLHDDVVPYWVPLHWAAKRRQLRKSIQCDTKERFICRVNTEGSHYGYDLEHSLKKDSEIVAFLEESVFLETS